MLHTLKLLLPALIPSWNFFDIIAPSPRIQYAIMDSQDDTATEWQASRPLPAKLPLLQILFRLIWNPYWNEYLFMMSCAERLLEFPTQHSEHEIHKRIAKELMQKIQRDHQTTYFQFRLQLVQRVDAELHEKTVYLSRVVALADYIRAGSSV